MPSRRAEVVVERVCFRAGGAELEGELAYPEAGWPRAKVVIAGPHPLLGGSVRNNVVRELGDGLAGQGFACLRFGYRHTGSSNQLAAFWRSSHCPAESDYQQDLRAAIDYLDDAAGYGLPLALVGYSFGCSLLGTAGRAADALVLIAPVVGTHDPVALAGQTQPRLVIVPEGDFAADEARLPEWLGRLGGPTQLLRPQLDGHFFRGDEAWLTDTVGEHLERSFGWRRSEA